MENTKVLESSEIENEEPEVLILKVLIKDNPVRNDDISGNVLILSDRMQQASKLLGDYLETVTKMKFIGVVNRLADLKTVDEKVDYLIIYGHLENDDNHNLIHELRNKSNKITTIFYASVSRVVKEDVKNNDVKFLFNRFAPLEMFLIMLERLFDRYDRDDKHGIKVDINSRTLDWEFSGWHV